MVRITQISDTNESNEELVSGGLMFEETPIIGRIVSPRSSASSLVFETSVNDLIELSNNRQCFFELLDAATRQGTPRTRIIEPKRVVPCGRKTLLEWVNRELHECYTDISQLNDGVAFCQLINCVDPGIIPRSKIKLYIGIPRWTDNFKLLRRAFADLKIKKAVPGQGKKLSPKEVLTFTSWFKAFIEANSQLIPPGNIIIGGVDDCPNYRDRCCGRETYSYYSEDILVSPSSSYVEIVDSRDHIKDNLKPDHNVRRFNLMSPRHQRDNKYCATSPIQNGLSNDNVPMEIQRKTFSHDRCHPIKLICPEKFTTCGRKTLLNWINCELSLDIVDLTELSDGAAFCLLVHNLSPETIPIKSITFNSDPFTHQYNYNLLTDSFKHHKVKKNIPVRKLIEHNTREILLFTNWLKAFYELNMSPIPAKIS